MKREQSALLRRAARRWTEAGDRTLLLVSEIKGDTHRAARLYEVNYVASLSDDVRSP